MPAPYQPPKPLWRFTWRGWCLLPILMALIWIAWTGYDLRYQLLSLVNQIFGHEYLFSFNSYWISMPSIFLLNPSTNRPIIPYLFPTVYFALPMLLALAIHPRHTGLRWPSLILAYALVAIPCIHGTQPWLRNALAIHQSLPWSWTRWEWPINPVTILAHLCLLWMSLRLLRAPTHGLYRLSAAFFVAVALAWCMTWDHMIERARFTPNLPASLWSFDAPLDLALRLAWHLAWLALWLTWSIRARLHHLPPHACQACGYDRTGLPSPTSPCPECGTTPTTTPAATSPATPPSQ